MKAPRVYVSGVDLGSVLGDRTAVTIVVEAPPAVIRLSEAELFARHTGFSPYQARRVARSDGFPIHVRGTGKARREYVLMNEVIDWLAAHPRVH